ncbi:hypothetical protein [Paraburkholderia sp. MM5482-R1]|uniref:hypothetical protein n=1 Tax=unclassified Paraburkholderia TaxID=2615204 RepID=UPI003D1EE963
MRHEWTANKAKIMVESTKYGVTATSSITFDFAALGLQSGGLMWESLHGLPCPAQRATVNKLKRVLELLATQSSAQSILSTAPGELQHSDIVMCLRCVDKVVEALPAASRYQYVCGVRSVLRRCGKLLKNGQTAALGIKSYASRHNATHPRARRYRQLAVAASKTAGFTQFDQHTLSRVHPTEAIHAANEVLHDAIEAYRQPSIMALDQHEDWAARIRRIKSTPQPPEVPQYFLERLEQGKLPARRSIEKLPQPAREWVLLQIVERAKFYEKGATAQLPFHSIDTFREHASSQGSEYAFEASLADIYLPRHVLLACLVILMLETNLNAGALLSLTPSQIVPLPGGRYRFVALKTKSNQLQASVTVNPGDAPVTQDDREIESSAAIRAVRLLLDHNKSVDLYAVRDTNSIFCFLCLRSSDRVFRTPTQLNKNFNVFVESLGLSPATLSKLRTLSINAHFTQSNGNLFAVQARAGHKSVKTTVDYLTTHMMATLSEASIIRFGRLLQKSIEWISGYNDLSADPEAASVKRLFPSSAILSETRDSICDKWINEANNDEPLAIQIGPCEAVHCARQLAFYRRHFHVLKSGDPGRFSAFHLPRIAFCIALHRAIEASPLAPFLK